MWRFLGAAGAKRGHAGDSDENDPDSFVQHVGGRRGHPHHHPLAHMDERMQRRPCRTRDGPRRERPAPARAPDQCYAACKKCHANVGNEVELEVVRRWVVHNTRRPLCRQRQHGQPIGGVKKAQNQEKCACKHGHFPGYSMKTAEPLDL